MSFRLVLILLRLPFDILQVVLRFYIFGGLKFRKYSRDLRSCLQVSVFGSALSVDIPDGKLLTPYSNSFLLKKIIPFISSALVKNTPGYGERYDAQSFWLVKQKDRKPSDPVLVYSHGGGYYLQTTPHQIRSILAIYQLLDTKIQKTTSILLLDYKLASEGYPFPTQLHQLSATYDKLISEGNDNITLFGDSAGGHLTVGFLSHLNSLKNSAENPVVYPKNIALISPWLKLCPSAADFQQGTAWYDNQDRDLVKYERFSKMLDTKELIGLQDPVSLLSSPAGKTPRTREDWSGIPCFSDPNYNVFLIFGEDESFRDDIIQWAAYALNYPLGEQYGIFSKGDHESKYEFSRKNEPGNANLTSFVEPWGVHDALFLLEQGIVLDVENSIRQGKRLHIEDVDREKYFGVVRLTEFFNSTLSQ